MTELDILRETFDEHISTIRVNDEYAYFTNLSDIHYGLNEKEYFLQSLEKLMKIPNLYISIGGDAGNGGTRISKSDPMEEYSSGEKQVYELAEILKPYADRIVSIHEGNHWAGRLKHEVYFTPEKMLATLIGKPDAYKGEQSLIYFNVGKACYVHFAQHSSPKRYQHFAYLNADVVWREHHHQKEYKESLILEHNKFTKKPIVKNVFEIWNGTFQVAPTYAKEKGYKLSPLGFYVVKMGKDKRDLKIMDNGLLYEFEKLK